MIHLSLGSVWYNSLLDETYSPRSRLLLLVSFIIFVLKTCRNLNNYSRINGSFWAIVFVLLLSFVILIQFLLTIFLPGLLQDHLAKDRYLCLEDQSYDFYPLGNCPKCAYIVGSVGYRTWKIQPINRLYCFSVVE